MLLCAVAYGSRAADTGALTLTRTIPLSGVKGRFDHFAIDTKGRRLFVAALGNNTLEVMDIAAGERVKSIAGLRKPTGVVYLSELNQIGVANGDDGTFKLRIGRIPTRAGARTSFFSTQRDEFYLAVPSRDGRGAEIRIYKPAGGAR